MIASRRTILDEILVEAAVEAGAELREEFVVRDEFYPPPAGRDVDLLIRS